MKTIKRASCKTRLVLQRLTRILFFSFIFCGASFRSSGLEIDFIFGLGAKGGLTKELVYQGPRLISRLDWADKVAPAADFAGTIEINNILFKLGMTFAVPVTAGAMEDYDYLLPNSTEPSNYSWHKTRLDRYFVSNAEAGYKFTLGNWHITPMAGFRYSNIKWTASGGYLQYPVAGHWTGNEPKIELSGPVISYEQIIWFPFAAMEAGYKHIFANKGRLNLAINGSIYPYIWAEADDIHFLRNIQFRDSLRGGIGWNAGLSAGFFPEKANGLGFIISSGYEAIMNVKGITASAGTGVSSGQLIITQGHRGKTEVSRWYASICILIPVYGM